MDEDGPISPICIDCPEGRTGPRCEACADGYFGDPTGLFGEIRPCQKCDCSGNINENAIDNCDTRTGECLKCTDNTDGFHCERCKSGFFGDPFALKKPEDPDKCQPCQCNPDGSNVIEVLTEDGRTLELPICNGHTGDCSCKPHVVGKNCDRCEDGYFKLKSKVGCEPCNCDRMGSLNKTCHVDHGQCHCNVGVTGKRCESCLPRHYGFSPDGCKPCDCDPYGSMDLQCDVISGQCPCWDKVQQL